MPGPLYHVGATTMCPHAAPAQTIASSQRVMVSGMAVAVLTDSTMIAGCPGIPPSGIPPCTKVQWLTGATRVLVNGLPPLLQSSTGLALNPAPAGPVTIVATQTRVVAL